MASSSQYYVYDIYLQNYVFSHLFFFMNEWLPLYEYTAPFNYLFYFGVQVLALLHGFLVVEILAEK